MARPSAKEDQKSERRAPLDFPVLIQSLSLCVRPPPPTQWPPADLQGRPSELFTSSRCTGPRVGLARVAQAKPISGCRQRLRHPVYLIVLLQPERAAFAPIPDPGGALPACLPPSPAGALVEQAASSSSSAATGFLASDFSAGAWALGFAVFSRSRDFFCAFFLFFLGGAAASET